MTKHEGKTLLQSVRRAAGYAIATISVIGVLTCPSFGRPVYADVSHQGGSIRCDETVDGRVRAGYEDRWTFEGSSGDVVTIAMRETDGMDPYLELQGPDGSFLIEDDDSGSGEYDARINRFRLPSDGTYTIVAQGLQHEGGSYRLSLSCHEPGDGGGSIGCGETVDGQVDTGGEDLWTFEGSSGDVVTISMSETDGMDTYLEVQGPDGRFLIEDDDSGSGAYDARITRFRLPGDGTYTIVAHGFRHQGGSYSLSLSCHEPGDAGGSIVCGQTVDGQVNAGDEAPWTFEGSSGDVVTISLSETDGMDTYLELYGPDGGLLTEDDDSGSGAYDSRINRFRLPSDGTYTIVARDFDYQGGSYRLSLSCNEPVDAGASIRCGQTADGRVEAGDEDIWAFAGSSGDIVTIAMSETDGMDTYLELYAPDGRLLTEDDDSGSGAYDARITEFLLPGDGTYTIVARGYDYEGGSYQLTLSCGGGDGAPSRPWQRIRRVLPWIGMGCCCFSGVSILVLVAGAAVVYQLYGRR